MRYVLVQDQSCHWYVIPTDKKAEWFQWCESDESEDGISPDWAYGFGGGPESVTFTNPEVYGQSITI